MPIPAPAEIDIAPVEPFSDETTLALAAGAGTEIVILPAPTPTDAIPAPEMFNRFENVPAEELVVFPRAVKDTEDVCTLADTVIVDPACPIPIPAPAERDTLLEVPFKLKFVAAGTVGPTIVMLDAPELKVMFAPATSDTLLEVPFSEKFVAVGTVGPMIWIEDAPVERVMLFPAESTIVPVDDAKVPAESAFCPEIVTVDRFEANWIFGPATKLTLLEEPLRLKFVAAGTVGPTIVIDDAPLFSVIFAPATKDTLDEVPFKLKLVAAGTFGPMI